MESPAKICDSRRHCLGHRFATMYACNTMHGFSSGYSCLSSSSGQPRVARSTHSLSRAPHSPSPKSSAGARISTSLEHPLA
jgi:hypothetical protein